MQSRLKRKTKIVLDSDFTDAISIIHSEMKAQLTINQQKTAAQLFISLNSTSMEKFNEISFLERVRMRTKLRVLSSFNM